MADRTRARGDQDGVWMADPPGAQRAGCHCPHRGQHARRAGAELLRHAGEPVRVGDHVLGAAIFEQRGHPGPGQGRVGVLAGRRHGADHVAGERAGQRTEPDRVR